MSNIRVTSQQVAQKAGVSQSAVSRVFTPGASASKKTIEKVQKAAAELGYRPNSLACAMVSGKSRIIGLVVAYLNNQFYPEALEKLSKKLQDEDIKWFEEPLSPEFYDQYSDFKSKSSIPVAAGECEYLRYGFQKLLDKNCIDFLQMDICSCGGLTEAKRISALSSTKGVKVIPHTWGSGIAFYTAINFIFRYCNFFSRYLFNFFKRKKNRIKFTL